MRALLFWSVMTAGVVALAGTVGVFLSEANVIATDQSAFHTVHLVLVPLIFVASVVYLATLKIDNARMRGAASPVLGQRLSRRLMYVACTLSGLYVLLLLFVLVFGTLALSYFES